MEFDATIVGAGGHLHDGSVDMVLKKNGQVMCDLVASYGTIPGCVDRSGIPHISDISECSNIGPTAKGDQWSITANYDFNKHQPMMYQNGTYASVMGIVIMYALDPNAQGPSHY